MRARRAPAVLVPMLTLVLAGPACTGDLGGPGQPDQVSSPPSVTSKDINETDREQLRDGGTLTWPLAQLPPNFNVGHLEGALTDNRAVVEALLPRPFHYDAAARPILNQDFMQSAELTSTDPQVVTYRINPEARWYDGTPITVADFEAQWRARNGSDPAFKVVSTQGYDKIGSVAQGRDEREVVVTYEEPFADWRDPFSVLYPASTNRDPGMFNDGWREKPLTTAGPFRFESLDKTAKAITLVRNERWWGRRAKLDRIVYRVIDPDSQIDALANGEVDLADVGPDVNKAARAEATPGIAIRKAAGPNFRHITFNGTSEVLRDVEVRRALALGINREIIAEALIGPLGVAAQPLNNHIFMANQRGYRDNTGDLGRHDPERANAMLDDAGWRAADGGVRVKDGKELAVRLVIPSQVATSKQEAELVQGMLGGVGVKVDVETVPSADFFKSYIAPGNFDLTVFSWLGSVFPVSSAKSVYAQPVVGDDGQLEVRQNYARVGSAQIDRLFDQATAEFDEDKVIELANQIDALIWREVHSLPLYQRPEIVAVREDLANFGAFGFASRHYEDIGYVRR